MKDSTVQQREETGIIGDKTAEGGDGNHRGHNSRGRSQESSGTLQQREESGIIGDITADFRKNIFLCLLNKKNMG